MNFMTLFVRTNRRLSRSRLTVEALEARAVPAVLAVEHVHFQMDFAGDAWHLYLTDTTNDVVYEPEEALLYVNVNARATQQPGQEFIGAGAGNGYWKLPQPTTPDVLTVAPSAEHIDPGTFDVYRPRDPRVARAGEWIKLALRDVQYFGDGVGYYSAWRDQQPAGEWWISSYDGGRNFDPVIYIESGGHVHYNFGFTAGGYYAVTFEASAFVGTTGLPVRSGDVTFYFGVETGEAGPGGAPGMPRANPLLAVGLLPSAVPLRGIELPGADSTPFRPGWGIAPSQEVMFVGAFSGSGQAAPETAPLSEPPALPRAAGLWTEFADTRSVLDTDLPLW